MSPVHQAMLAFGDDLRNYSPALGKKMDVLPFPERRIDAGAGQWLHFFIDDVRFERIYKNPLRYAKRLHDMGLDGMVGFDFSLYDNYPLAVNAYNAWRNAALSHILSEVLQIPLLPVACWSSHNPEWSSGYIQENSAVALGSYPLKGGNRSGYMAGLNHLMKTLQPCELHIFGNVPPNVRFACPVFQYDLHYQTLNQQRQRATC